jgi:TPR repeat protein
VFKLAADQDFIRAHTLIGVMYDDGMGVPTDYALAMKWYRLAAAQGDTDALNGMGVLYAWGRGVRPDVAEGKRIFRRAAEMGNDDAQKNLALSEQAEREQQYTPGGELVLRKRPGDPFGKRPVLDPWGGRRR